MTFKQRRVLLRALAQVLNVKVASLSGLTDSLLLANCKEAIPDSNVLDLDALNDDGAFWDRGISEALRLIYD